MAHKHPVYDTDKHFVIDPITKKISTECPKVVLPQHSHRSERFTFEIPKMVEGHDMSLCNLVQIHYQNIEAVNKSNKNIGIYKVDDLQTEGDTVFGSWLIDGNSTYYVGGLIFAMHFICLSDDGKIDYDLPTLSYSTIAIGETVWNSETIVNEHSELLTEFESRIARLEKGRGKIGEVELLASAWVGEESPYAQLVVIDGITEYSQVDLTPSVEQLAIFHNKDLAFVTENEDGVVTVYAIGDKPTNDYTIQVTITEVKA
ncbi:hypothetical protein H9185_001160 [Listeria monocytogenes]|nr:hypothetical protein [Listeria monocytogenes]